MAVWRCVAPELRNMPVLVEFRSNRKLNLIVSYSLVMNDVAMAILLPC